MALVATVTGKDTCRHEGVVFKVRVAVLYVLLMNGRGGHYEYMWSDNVLPI